MSLLTEIRLHKKYATAEALCFTFKVKLAIVAENCCASSDCRSNSSASCGLTFAPCTYNGSLYSTVPLTQDLGFDVIDPMEFAEGYIGLPASGVLVRQRCIACSIQVHHNMCPLCWGLKLTNSGLLHPGDCQIVTSKSDCALR